MGRRGGPVAKLASGCFFGHSGILLLVAGGLFGED